MSRCTKHIKGDRAELIAQEFFIEKGFYVFNNISQHGPVDMAVMDKDGNIMLVDVKALSLRTKNGWKVNRVPTKEQDKLGIELVFVNLDTKEVLDEVPNARYDDNIINYVIWVVAINYVIFVHICVGNYMSHHTSNSRVIALGRSRQYIYHSIVKYIVSRRR